MMDEKVILKECPQHGLTEYTWRPSEKRYRCRRCASEYIQKKRYKVKEKAVEYKGGKCEMCGYDKCIDALEFHHLDPSQKDFGIGYKGYVRSWDKVKKELDKCIMVCANCHREIHAREKEEYKESILNKKQNALSKYEKYAHIIVDMKDNGESFYKIAKELNIARNTAMKYYKQYKNNC